MATFTDTKGREWNLSLDLASMEHIRDVFKIDLFNVWAEEADIWEFLDDLSKFGQVIWWMLEEQLAAQNVDDLKSGLSGDVISDAQDAFLEARADFFPNKKRREAFLELVKKTMEFRDQVIDLGRADLADQDPSALANTFVDSATSSPESPESTPDR